MRHLPQEHVMSLLCCHFFKSDSHLLHTAMGSVSGVRTAAAEEAGVYSVAGGYAAGRISHRMHSSN